MGAENSYRFVESKRSQRIEAWWSFCKRNCSAEWIDFLKDLAERDIFFEVAVGDVAATVGVLRPKLACRCARPHFMQKL